MDKSRAAGSVASSVAGSVADYIDSIGELLMGISDAVWDYAETAFEEYRSAAIFKETLARQGFTVEDKTGGIDTAFCAGYGSGKPVIGILAEYDALSGLSQKALALTEEKRGGKEDNGNGHGCGHNLLGAGALGAALAVKEYLAANKLPGTVKLFGCPGEEGGSGKAFMARAGVFEGLDVAFTWHPFAVNAVMEMKLLANYQVLYKFRGKAAHAAASPHLGRSALDAVELMNVGVNFLREHVIPEARIHYAITHTGGFSPNVVQARGEVLYLIRSPRLPQVEEIYRRVNKIAQGAALMTETDVEIEFIKACADVIPNKTLGRVLYDNFKAQELPRYTAEEAAYAAALAKTSLKPPGSEAAMFLSNAGKEQAEYAKRLGEKKLCDLVLPFYDETPEPVYPGSSDVGDVSWNVPTAQIAAACYALGTAEHSWQLVSQTRSSLGHKGLLLAAKVIAAACVDVLEHPELAEKAKAEWERRLEGHPYRSAIPPEVKPRPIGTI
ncbi:MAG: amidohydrolase [Spirochaetaceae bacterium]|jgi:aminobenzoyl-glutamate utilization protein B|nr:amidohydrolase [Spirochaetaceae bacterium]